MKKTLVTMFLAIFAIATACAQTGDGKKLSKQERKALQARIDSLTFQKALSAIK